MTEVRDGGNTNSVAEDMYCLTLDKDDFDRLDSNKNGRLNLLELTQSASSGEFTGAKQKAVEGLRDSLIARGTTKIDSNHESAPIFEEWDQLNIATKYLSQANFDRIDKNKNRILSRQELDAFSKDKSKSPVDRAATAYLASALASPRDERFVVGEDGVRNWHELSEKFKNMTLKEVSKVGFDAFLNENWQGSKEAYDELVKRGRFAKPVNMRDFIADLRLSQTALKEDRCITVDSHGNRQLGDAPLSLQDRLALHKRISSSLSDIDLYRAALMSQGTTLLIGDEIREGAELYTKAISEADKSLINHKVGDSQVTISSIIKDELAQLKLDRNLSPDDIAQYEQDLSTVLRAPIDSRAQAAGAYLAPCSIQENKTKFNFDAHYFDPYKSEKLLDEARTLGKTILGIDLATSEATSRYPATLSLSGRAWEKSDPNLRYNLFFDGDKNGKSDLVEKLKSYTWYGEKLLYGRKLNVDMPPTRK